MDFPELHRKYERVPTFGTKPAVRPGGLPRKGEFHFRPFTAYWMDAGKLSKSTIWEKPDQNFSAYATPFEREWSKLVSLSNSLDPVVDNDCTIVGHTGVVDCGLILVPKNLPSSLTVTSSNYKHLLSILVKEGIPFFVGRQPPNDAWVRYMPKAYTEKAGVTVMTSIDGQVLSVSEVRITGAGAQTDAVSPVDLFASAAFFLVKGIVNLGVAASRFVVKGLARKSAAAGVAKTVVFAGPTKELALSASRAAMAQTFKRTTQYIPESGMTAKHFAAFQAAAKETNVIAVVRNNKLAATKLIEAGCPGKPKFFKFGTNSNTGILTAKRNVEINLAWEKDYFVVGADGVARREVVRQGKRVTETLELKNPFWNLEKGQVIDPVAKKPVVGDYDLMGVWSPSSPGQNITLATKEGVKVRNRTSPIVDKFTETVNPKLDRMRVLHGAQDQFASFRGGATAFHPDGTVTFLPDADAVKAFYASYGRKTIVESYN